MEFNKLVGRSYNAIKKRGLINEFTTESEFIDKLTEEQVVYLASSGEGT